MPRDYLTGEHFEYYMVCHTKLWYHHNRMIYASHHSDVKLGSLLDESSFDNEEKVNLGSAVADFIEVQEDSIVISEVKKSSSMDKAHKLQVLHYLWIINGKDVDKKLVGKIMYPEENQITRVNFDDNESWYNSVKEDINEIISGDIPEIYWKDACKNCSMREFCYS